MQNDGVDESDKRRRASVPTVCGVLSLLCWLPVLVLGLAQGRLALPDSLTPAVIYSLFYGPLAGLLLALTAMRASRRWLVLVLFWVCWIGYGWWDLSRHPFAL